MSVPLLEVDEDLLRALIVLKDHQLYPIVLKWIGRELEKFKLETSQMWQAPEFEIRASMGMTEILQRLDTIFRDPKTGLGVIQRNKAAQESKLPLV